VGGVGCMIRECVRRGAGARENDRGTGFVWGAGARERGDRTALSGGGRLRMLGLCPSGWFPMF